MQQYLMGRLKTQSVILRVGRRPDESGMYGIMTSVQVSS